MRKLRAASRESEADRERLQARLAQQDQLLDKETERYEKAAEMSAQQVTYAGCAHQPLNPSMFGILDGFHNPDMQSAHPESHSLDRVVTHIWCRYLNCKRSWMNCTSGQLSR